MDRFPPGLPARSRGRLGLRPGDRVALAMTNNPEYLAILFAIWRAGLVAVPANAKLHARELAYIVEDCGAQALPRNRRHRGPLAGDAAGSTRLVVLETRIGAISSPPIPADVADRRPDDLAWIFYTSGTTGKPKGAMLSHRNLMTMAVGYLADIDFLSPEDCPLSSGRAVARDWPLRPVSCRQSDASGPAAERRI